MNDRDKAYISRDLTPSLIIPTLFFLVVSFVLTHILIVLTWGISLPWLGLSSLGEWSAHSSFIADGFWHFLGFSGDENRWIEYASEARRHGVFRSVLAHLTIPLIIAIGAAFALARVVHMGLTPKLDHISGLKYAYDTAAGLTHLKLQILELDGKDQSGIPIHPDVPISRERDNKGLLIMGGMGSGKTQFQLPRIRQIIEQNHRLFINDSKGEFTQSLESDDFVLLAPWDSRSKQWHISKDVCDRSSARVLAELYIKGSHDPMWGLAARQVLVGMLVSLIETKPGTWGFSDLVNVMTLEAEPLAELIKKYNPEALQTIRNLESKTGKTAEGIMINLQSFMSPFYDMEKAWSGVGGFSIRDWLSEDYAGPRTVIVQGSERFKTIATGLVGSLLTFVISDMADPSFPEARNRSGDYRVYFNLDEFPTMGRVPLIERLISVCRSKGAYVTLSFQDIAQGVELYGKELIDTWITNLSNKVIGSVAMGPTAAFISNDILKEREVNIPTCSKSFDQFGKPSKSISQMKDRVPVIKPNELSQDLGFPPGKSFGYGLYLGERLDTVYRLKWKKTFTREVRPSVVLADWALQSNQTWSEYKDAFPLQEKCTPSPPTKEIIKEEVEPATQPRRLHDLNDDERVSLIEYLRASEIEDAESVQPIEEFLPVIIGDLKHLSYKIKDTQLATFAHNFRLSLSEFSPDQLKEPILQHNLTRYMQRRGEFNIV